MDRLDKNQLSKKLDILAKQLYAIETRVISGKEKHKQLHLDLYKIHKQFLQYEMDVHKHIMRGDVHENEVKHITKKLKVINKNIVFLNGYYKTVLELKQKQTMDSLTLITLIFLPLTLITGYFGMNFGDMGSPTKKSGIFALRSGQHLVSALFIISILVIIVLVRLGIIYG